MIKTIFLDFDGTICDSRKLIYDNMVWILKEKEYVFDERKLKELLGDKLENILKKIGLKGNVEEIRRKFYLHLNKSIEKTKLKLCVPVKPLEELKKKYPLIVISNAQSDFTKKCAKKLKVIKLFDKIYGAESFKTKGEVIKKLLKTYKIKPHEAIYVGDRFSDVDYARNAGCWAVAIHNKCSWSSKKRILKEKPDFIIEDFNGLKKVVERINDG